MVCSKPNSWVPSDVEGEGGKKAEQSGVTWHTRLDRNILGVIPTAFHKNVIVFLIVPCICISMWNLLKSLFYEVLDAKLRVQGAHHVSRVRAKDIRLTGCGMWCGRDY